MGTRSTGEKEEEKNTVKRRKKKEKNPPTPNDWIICWNYKSCLADYEKTDPWIAQ